MSREIKCNLGNTEDVALRMLQNAAKPVDDAGATGPIFFVLSWTRSDSAAGPIFLDLTILDKRLTNPMTAPIAQRVLS